MSALPDVGPLGYEPLAGEWICDLHGVPDCTQTEHCQSLPWVTTQHPMLGPFLDWADEQFRKTVAPFDRQEVEEMPDEAFDAYFPAEWPGPL